LNQRRILEPEKNTLTQRRILKPENDTETREGYLNQRRTFRLERDT